MPVAWRDQILLHRPGEIVGYDRSKGERKWAIAITSEGTGTPVISGDMAYFAAWLGADDLMDPMPSWDVMLQKYDKNHDGLISKDEFPGGLAISRRVDAAKVPGAIVTVKGFFDRMVDRDHDGQVSEAEWNAFLVQMKTMLAKPRGLMAIRLDSESKRIEWNETRAVPEVPMPRVYRDRVYAVTNGGIVTALDRRSGTVIYRARLGAGGVYYSSPVEAGGKIYFASGDGVECVADASGDTLNVIARNDLGEPIFATPAIVDGRIYVRTAGHLHAFGK
jgi:outer membrane protein assembly factor BamB